jgi:hypothetical protein
MISSRATEEHLACHDRANFVCLKRSGIVRRSSEKSVRPPTRSGMSRASVTDRTGSSGDRFRSCVFARRPGRTGRRRSLAPLRCAESTRASSGALLPVRGTLQSLDPLHVGSRLPVRVTGFCSGDRLSGSGARRPSSRPWSCCETSSTRKAGSFRARARGHCEWSYRKLSCEALDGLGRW